ncbi:MAG: cadherin repeat domain-containing protein [Pirellulaceae bacterium]
MNPRERLLALVVGCLGSLLVLYFGWSYVDSAYRTRRDKIANLENELQKFRQQVTAGQLAVRKLGEYEARSLPPAPDVARSLYQNWLLTQVSKAGLSEQLVKPGSTQQERDLYVSQGYDVTGQGTLPQVVELLHAFYSTDHLHRIRSLTLKPLKQSKRLEVAIEIDAVSMLSAPEAAALDRTPSVRLALPKKADYLAAIVDRNLFGPPNQAPRLSVSGSTDVLTNRPADLTAKATDADPLDKLTYRLVASDAPDAKLDPSSGRFSWTPKSTGKFAFTIEAVDDGLPARPVRQELVLNVTDPPVVEPPRGFTGFDDAKFTDLTAVLDIGGESEIWLHIRPQGRMLKLREGDEFEIGSVKGLVERIGESDFTFQVDGKLRRLVKGEMLDQAAPFASTGQTE